jgi:hypothetical protein
MTEIALAYSSIDKARAEAIGKVLGALGYKLTPQPLTQAGVEQAKALVVFWSSGSVNSIPINQFASQASCDKKLVSVRCSHADPPAAYALVALHDLSRWTGSLDAPELRTFLQHILRMAPPAGAAQAQPAPPPQAFAAPRAPVGAAAGGFAFAGPMGAATRPGEGSLAMAGAGPAVAAAAAPQAAPRPARAIGLRTVEPAPPAPIAPAPAPAPIAAAQPAPAAAQQPAAASLSRRERERPQDRPSVRRAAERRRAQGGGAARVAVGAIAVSVIAGAAVAAFNYEPGQQTAAKSGDESGAALSAAVTVQPNEMTAPQDQWATPAAPVAGPVEVASADPVTLPAAVTGQAPAATLQSNRGWTASLPTTPSRPTATPVSAGAPPPQRARAASLTPIDASPAPAPTDLVAIDSANLGDAPGNSLASRPRSPEEERAWIRKNAEYGPTQ